MSAAETELLDALMTRLAALHRSAEIDLALIGELPLEVEAFERLSDARQSASRAFLRSFEQIEDQTARVFRLLPRFFEVDSAGWFSRDHADFMERLGVLNDAADWSAVVKLRNELVHDYPVDAAVRLERLRSAVGRLPFLRDIRQRLIAFIETARKDHRL